MYVQFLHLISLVKNYDFSARCSLVWTGDYFAYRCRTCGLTPSMSLCGACFTAGNHENHDFNKFKSMCGGACDCGDQSVIRSSGNCRFHGADKVANRPCPPKELTAVLEFLLPSVMKALMFWFWDRSKGEEVSLTETEAPLLYFLHRLHACGWVTQKLMADVLINPDIYQNLLTESACTSACRSFLASVASDPCLSIKDVENTQKLNHKTLLDAFLFMITKLRFPESLGTLLIGLLAVSKFKEKFLDSYVDHYSRMASTLMITARVRNISPEASMQLNNRIVHISVQLFSGEEPAYRMVKERSVHYIIVTWMRNMFAHSRTRLDDRGNMVVNCDAVLIQNNAFWPLTSDLNNLLSHKSVADIFVEDKHFLSLWTDILRSMQFMNCFSMKEGSHIEYETLACYHGLTMEIEVGITSMWYIWQHYKSPPEKAHCLMYTNACLETLANHLTHLGRLVASSTQWTHPIRGPLSLHLPLSRHAACFLWLSVLTHQADLKTLMAPFLKPNSNVLRRLMEELANVLLGCHEVIIGYWVRNGQPIRQSVMHYMQSQLCYSMIDLDIFFFQVCAALLHPVYVLNALVDQSRLLQSFCFHRELMSLTTPSSSTATIDRQPMAIEAWLTNLCWIIDLRNNLGLSETGLIEKELVCFLAPDSRKRSDLSYLLPDRCGLPTNSSAIDECLEKVATYSAPSCDNISGSLVSGHYFLKPELWHEKFDPVFYSLRITSKRELASAMEKYRNHCRQIDRTQNTSAFWPPYRLPLELSPEFVDLENVLHSRHLHYLLFCLLSLYVYGDPLMTEESLVIVIHLLYRAVVAGGVLLKEGQDPNRLDVAVEPTMPHFDPIECTEACMAATNREAELQAMQFADADSETEEDEEESEEIEEGKATPVTEASTAEPMDVQESPVINRASTSSVSTAFVRKPSLKRTYAFRVRRPPTIPLKWDLSIVACPYPAPKSTPTIFDNLSTWIATSQQTVVQASLEVKTTQENLEYTLPKRDESCPMVDSLLSLLVKAHARLQWNHLVNTVDSQAPQSSVATCSSAAAAAAQDSAFINLAAQADPQAASDVSALAARCMSVLNDTNIGESGGEHSGTGPISSPLARALQAGSPNATPEERMLAALNQMAPELRYFAVGQPAYKIPEEKRNDNGVECGDGVFWVTRLLDKIVELSDECKTQLKMFIERAKDPFNMNEDSKPVTEAADSSLLLSGLQNNTLARAQRKRAASERRKRLLDQMASKQRAFASNFLKDIEMDKLDDDTMDNLESKMDYDYDCVICQAVPPEPQPMVLLVMLCESGLMQQMRNYPNLPQLSGERMFYSQSYLSEEVCLPRPMPIVPPEVRHRMDNAFPRGEPHSTVDPDAIGSSSRIAFSRLPGTLIMSPSSTIGSHTNNVSHADVLEPVAYVESRRWWNLALPMSVSLSLPLLRSGVLLQTCGHAVHRECFQRYRHQSMHQGGISSTRWLASCPLCRRDVHYLLPLHRTTNSENAVSSSEATTAVSAHKVPDAHSPVFQCLREKLTSLTQQEHSFWSNLVGGGDDDPQNRYSLMADLFGKVSEVAVLLRTQFEAELSVLMVCPSQYHSVVRRCLFQELMNYMRYVYRSPSDLVSLVDSLTLASIPGLNNPASSKQPSPSATSSGVSPMFGLCNDPADVFLTLLPHVWPNQDHFLALSAACICLSYTRALVGLVLGQIPSTSNGSYLYSQRSAVQCTQDRMKNIPSPLKSNILAVVSCLNHLLDSLPCSSSENEKNASMRNFFATTYSTTSNAPSDVAVNIQTAANLEMLQLTSAPMEAGRELQDHVISRVLPCLRLVALCYARWLDSFHVHDENSSGPVAALSLPFVGVLSNAEAPELEKGQLVKEFLALGSFLGIGYLLPAAEDEDDPMLGVGPLLPFVQAAALRSGLTESLDGPTALDELLHRWINQMSSTFRRESILSIETSPDVPPPVCSSLDAPATADSSIDAPSSPSPPTLRQTLRTFYPFRSRPLRGGPHLTLSQSGVGQRPETTAIDWVKYLGPLMSIGGQLYPPRLIRPPHAFDDLFNSLHLVACATSRHQFQKNVLCLICGQLLCDICFPNLGQLMYQHAYRCDGFAGVALEINTSLVHVSLGLSSCEWGSIYLDSYGEEDLDLKRGKPLFLNEERFAMLESQWLSHSFRHVLKHWRHN
uniref:E3 ubiquitin-protein ligase n=1 Tax=Mesocestoides corti TaxID=53468 RepID=A0A5K3FC77_MESCO